MTTAYLLIETLICRSDSGTEAAVNRIHRNAIEAVYAQANIEIVWLEPKYLDSSDVKDGSIGPDSIVTFGIDRHLWGSGPPRITLVMVNAINGTTGPRGLGMQSGPICFVAMTEEDNNTDREVFVVAHEVGHCMGLIHAVDDPDVASDISCIMGGGDFSDRTGDGALQPSHIITVRRSPFLLFESDNALNFNQLNDYL